MRRFYYKMRKLLQMCHLLQNAAVHTLNNHVPRKTKFLIANHANFVSKELTKAVLLC